eukprot:CAMPEP_0184505708 /NCGR_PEP_ID=MMETSP0113_2-20130426/53122_1 /TAXON_ID=91329 /ORGANISM="Norrisiella sphaerica, Strain BC52" /LENGTH=53 /DNA_ID=CAMNT_0026895407 /DNA_START=1422 /DNA_END=1583 /DNA_ORIENTATION=+
MKHAVAMFLSHFGVDVEARESHLRDALGEQLHSFDLVTKDDALVDIQFLKKGL